MTTKTRLVKLEQKQAEKDPEKITVRIIGADPKDLDYVIIDQYGAHPVRMLRSDYEAEILANQAAGEEVIIISPETVQQAA